MTRAEIPVVSAISLSMSKNPDMEGLKLSYSNCPEEFYNNIVNNQLELGHRQEV
jgi:hypothetical protein